MLINSHNILEKKGVKTALLSGFRIPLKYHVCDVLVDLQEMELQQPSLHMGLHSLSHMITVTNAQ